MGLSAEMLKQTFLTVFVLLACCLALMKGVPTSRLERCLCNGRGMFSVNIGHVAKFEFHMRNGRCNKEELIVIFRNSQKLCLDVNGVQGRRIKQAIMESNNANRGSSN